MINTDEKTFYLLRNDIIFKNTFDTKERLKRLLEETLGLKVDDVYKVSTEVSLETVTERRKYLDLILKTDKGIISVELNYGYKDELPNRNFIYFCKLISSSIKKTKSYTKISKHIQLNITWHLDKYFDFDIKDRKIIKCHVADDEIHEKIYDDIFEIVYINMDYFEDVWYHGNIKEENPFLMLLAAPTEEKMDLISKGDKFMEELSNKVKRLNEDPEIIDVIIENEDEIIANSIYDNGVNDGISQGIKQKSVEIARNLLQMNMSINDIVKATGLSIKDLNKLKEEI